MAYAYSATAGTQPVTARRRLAMEFDSDKCAVPTAAATNDTITGVRDVFAVLAVATAGLLSAAMITYGERYSFWTNALSDLGLLRTPEGHTNTASALLFAAAMIAGSVTMARCAALLRASAIRGAVAKQTAAVVSSIGFLVAIFPHDSLRSAHFAGCAAMVGGLWLLAMLLVRDLVRSRRHRPAVLVALILNLPMLPYAAAFAADADGKQALQKVAVIGLIAALLLAAEAVRREAARPRTSRLPVRLSRRSRAWQARPAHRSDERSALVISGGGSKGAFAVGVLRDLYDSYRSHGWFSIVGGSSTGALIAPAAAMLAAPGELAQQAMDVLEESYTTISTTDVIERQTWRALVRRRDALNSSKPLRQMLDATFPESWFEWLATEDAPLCYVVYTNLRTGSRVIATPRDSGMTRARFLDAMLASASVPGIMETVRIGDDPCVDGTLRDLVPADFAVESGATTLVPILLDPHSESWDGPLDRFDRVLARAFAVLVDEVGRNDLEIPRFQAMGTTVRDALLGIRQISTGLPSTPQVLSLRAALDALLENPELSPLLGPDVRLNRIVDGVRPGYTLTDDALDFTPAQMRRWYRHGLEVSRTVLREAPF